MNTSDNTVLISYAQRETMRWVLTAVAAIAGYIMGGFAGMELLGEYAPEFELFGLQGYLAGLVLGAAIGGVAAGGFMFYAMRDL